MQERNTLQQLFQNCILFGSLVQAALYQVIMEATWSSKTWSITAQAGLCPQSTLYWSSRSLNAALLFNKCHPWSREQEISPVQGNMKRIWKMICHLCWWEKFMRALSWSAWKINRIWDLSQSVLKHTKPIK